MPLLESLNRVLESKQQERRDEQSTLLQLAKMKLDKDQQRVNTLYDAYTRSQADEKNLMDQYLKTVNEASNYIDIEERFKKLPNVTKDALSIAGLNKMRLADRAKELQGAIAQNRDDQEILSNAILELNSLMAGKKQEILKADLNYKKALTANRGNDRISKTNRQQDRVLTYEMSRIKGKQDKLFTANDVESLSELKEFNQNAYREYLDLENKKERFLNMRTNLADENFAFNNSDFKGLVRGNKIVEGISTDSDRVNNQLTKEFNKYNKNIDRLSQDNIGYKYSKLANVFESVPEEMVSGKTKAEFNELQQKTARAFMKKSKNSGKPIQYELIYKAIEELRKRGKVINDENIQKALELIE